MQQASSKKEKPIDAAFMETVGVASEMISEESRKSETAKAQKSLIKSAGLVSFFTLMSRVVGMVRDVVSAKMFGTSRVWDAFLYAFTITNFLRGLVAEGALSKAFIPVYAEVLREKGREEADKVGNIVCTILTLFLGALLVLFSISVQLVLSFFPLPDKIRLTLRLLEILFPYIFFLAHVALSMGILNCHKHFFTPSLSPILLNIIWLLAILFVCPFASTLEGKAYLLAVCILVAGLAQFAFQIFPLRGLGYRVQFAFEFFHPAIRKIFVLIVPAVMSFAVTQVSILLDMTLAFFVGDGANASLYFGNRLMQFPLGIFGIALGTVLLPTFSHQANDYDELRRTLSFSLRTVFFIVVPASCGLIFLKTPIVKVLFERGHFDAISTLRTANTLMCYSIGLFAYAGQKAVTSTFFAMQDSKTPFMIAGFSLTMDFILNLILMWPFKEAGLALSTSIGGILDFVLLFLLLEKKVNGLDRPRIVRSLLKISVLSIIMGVLSYFFYSHLHFFIYSETLSQIVYLLSAIAFGVLVYVGLSFLFKVEEIRDLVQVFIPS